jgi:hypothetical protein
VKRPLNAKQLARIFSDTFGSENGQTALNYLRAGCMQPPDYAQPRNGMQVALHAAFLDGQRELIRKIERLMEQAKPETAAEETEPE